MSYRSGFVAIVGRPNTGKSTLVNALVGQKVSIVSDKPQTTRGRIRAVLTTDEHQIVFTDTPGFHKPRTLLGKRLNEVVGESTADVDAVVLVIDAAAGVGRGDAYVARDRVAPLACPKLCAANKIDLLRPAQVLPQLEAASKLGAFDEIVPVSARSGDGLDRLLELIAATLPEGPRYFEAGEVTDQSLEHRVAEIVREKALEITREELPHSIAVQVEELEHAPGLIKITATVLVERESQKGMVIGRGGEVMKRIGTRARRELETALGEKIYLELRVKVQKGWPRDPAALARLGY